MHRRRGGGEEKRDVLIRKKRGRRGLGGGFTSYLFLLDLLPFWVLGFYYFHFLFLEHLLEK